MSFGEKCTEGRCHSLGLTIVHKLHGMGGGFPLPSTSLEKFPQAFTGVVGIVDLLRGMGFNPSAVFCPVGSRPLTR
jgi:hypothetical protein